MGVSVKDVIDEVVDKVVNEVIEDDFIHEEFIEVISDGEEVINEKEEEVE